VKFSSADDPAFQTVAHHINFVIQNATPKVIDNWDQEIILKSQSVIFIVYPVD